MGSGSASGAQVVFPDGDLCLVRGWLVCSHPEVWPMAGSFSGGKGGRMVDVCSCLPIVLDVQLYRYDLDPPCTVRSGGGRLPL